MYSEKNYIVIYFPFSVRDNLNVGSSIRIEKMRTYFREFCNLRSIELLEISGEQRERRKKIKIIKSIKPKNILYCYSEFQNIPLVLSNKNHIPTDLFVDLDFFSYLKRNNIPVGAFYRDIYWKFDDMYPLKGI